jgi:F5/8 type C domain-containing protein
VPVRTPLWALTFYTVVTAVLGRHVLADLGTSIAKDPGDPLLTAAILHWNAHHMPLTDAWWQFPIFFPTRDALAFSEHLLGVSVLASPISWITGNSLATYNLTVLLTFPLCAMAMYALVYRLTHNAAGAFIAGLAYGFAPYRISTLSHIQMLASFWAPLALLGLHGFIAAGRPSTPGPPAAEAAPHNPTIEPRRPAGVWLLLYGAGWLLQALANGYMLVFFSVFVGLWVLWFVVLPRRWLALAAIAATTAVAAMPLLPILYKYVGVHAQHGFERSTLELHAFSADVSAVLCAPSTLTFWGWLRVGCRAEGELFPGVGVTVLFVAGLVLFLRHPVPRPVRWAVGLFIAVACLYAVIVTVVVLAGPQRVDFLFVHFSASRVAKPLLVAIAAGSLAFLAAVASRGLRPRPPVLGFYLLAAVVMWLLALGPMPVVMGEPSGRPGPFVWVQWMPGASGLRVPARFWLLAVLALSAAAGITMARFSRSLRPTSRRVLTALAAGVILADAWMPGIVAAPPPPDMPDPSGLRGQVVLQLPVERSLDIAATWRAVVGGWTSVNGFSGYAPNYYFALTHAASTADVFAPFRQGHDLSVVVADTHPATQAAVEQQSSALPVAHAHGARQYRLRAMPARTAETAWTGVPIVSLRSPCEADDLHFALDRDPRTTWQCARRDRQELIADIGAPAMISGLVYALGPYWWNAPDRLTVSTSIDGVRWQDQPTAGVLAALIEGGMRDPKKLEATLSFAPTEARYVRLQGSGEGEEFLFVVSELQIRVLRRFADAQHSR